ncbi:MAG: energy transducer TonB [Bacteroidia bacterium]
MKNSGIYSEEWCEMIFKGKNHEYGAYELRKDQVKRHIIAVLLSSTLVTMVIGSPIIINNVLNKKDNTKMDERYILSDVVLNPPQKKTDVEVFIEPSKIHNSIKNVVPIISENIDESDIILSNDQVFNDSRVIATVTIENQSDDPDAKILKEKTIVSEPIAEVTYVVVSQMPNFPGGDDEMFKYLKTAMRYPREALELNISGIVYTSFIINSSGNIQDIKILRGIGGGCDEEAIRVLLGMPKWNPGKQNGNAVNVKLTLPINFVLK